MINNIYRMLERKFFHPESRFGYSQFGEDLIINHLFFQLGIDHPIYLDVGANEPRYISNTYLFYVNGGHGVLVEPNPLLARKLMAYRPRDKVLNAGIGIDGQNIGSFYMFPSYASGLSTFSEKDAMHWERVGMKGLGKIPVESIIQLPLLNINSIIEQNFYGQRINLLSIDVEGLDVDILKSIDFERCSPDVICVETLFYDESQRGIKSFEATDFLSAMGYHVYADTRVNTIYCRSELMR